MKLASLLIIALTSLVAGTAPRSAGSDARRILEAHLSHGIGDDPFDSASWHDDLNAALIVRARSRVSMAELQQIVGDREGLSTRVATLERDGFLRREGDRVRAAFPILVGNDRDAYEGLVSQAAAVIEKETRSQWQALLRELSARGWAAWSYHFAWSQTMDSGFAWASMMQEGRVPPLSHVVVWVIYPAHPFQSGTNHFPDTELRDQTLAVTWRPGTANTVGQVGGQWRTVFPAALTGMMTTQDRQRLRALGLVDETGRVLVPWVRKADPLYARLELLAQQHVRSVAEHVPLARLSMLTGADDKLTFAMAYHDASWDVIRRMVEMKTLPIPLALRQGADENVSMVGVCAVIDSHPAIVSELKKALGVKP